MSKSGGRWVIAEKFIGFVCSSLKGVCKYIAVFIDKVICYDGIFGFHTVFCVNFSFYRLHPSNER